MSTDADELVFKFKFEALPEISCLDELLAATCKFLLLTSVVNLLEELVERFISSAINFFKRYFCGRGYVYSNFVCLYRFICIDRTAG